MGTPQHTKLTVPKMADESDTESFHSAISSVTRNNRRQTCKPVIDDPAIPDSLLKPKTPTKRPRLRTTCSLQNSTSSQHETRRPLSTTSRQSYVSIPNRQSSLPEQKTRSRQDSKQLHHQSCQLFSSLDGMLSMSRDITPLPSVSSSRTTTRHASLSPDGAYDEESIQRICAKIDARLLLTAGAETETQQHQLNHPYPYSHPYQSISITSSANNSPSIPSGFNPTIDEHSSLLSRSHATIHTTSQAQRPTLNTVISWTSNATRRAEYEKIDRAHTGLRGAVKRVWPSCLRQKCKRRAFFTGECDGDSVRRFRMDVEGEDGGSGSGNDCESESENEVGAGEDVMDEKTALRAADNDADDRVVDVRLEDENRTGLETNVEKEKAISKIRTKKPWWSCL